MRQKQDNKTKCKRQGKYGGTTKNFRPNKGKK